MLCTTGASPQELTGLFFVGCLTQPRSGPGRLEILSLISRIRTIAVGAGIRDVRRLRKSYGKGRWRKRKGFATVRLSDGTIWFAELHWYEAHGIGKKEIKIKRYLAKGRPPRQ